MIWYESCLFTDEKLMHNNLLSEDICETIRCENGKCLEWSKISDGVSDCFDSRDEADEAWAKKETYCQYTDDPYCSMCIVFYFSINIIVIMIIYFMR